MTATPPCCCAAVSERNRSGSQTARPQTRSARAPPPASAAAAVAAERRRKTASRKKERRKKIVVWFERESGCCGIVPSVSSCRSPRTYLSGGELSRRVASGEDARSVTGLLSLPRRRNVNSQDQQPRQRNAPLRDCALTHSIDCFLPGKSRNSRPPPSLPVRYCAERSAVRDVTARCACAGAHLASDSPRARFCFVRSAQPCRPREARCRTTTTSL